MNSDFSIIEKNGVKLISADCINALGPYRAYFSTGFGGVSDMPGGCSMNLAMFKNCPNDTRANQEENFRRFADACGFPLERLSLHREVHEPGIAVVTRADIPWNIFDRAAYGEADGQVTADREVALFVYAADCCTILLADAGREVSGATHCGWRNSVNGTPEALIDAFRKLGGRPEHAVAAIGPAICKRHYDVDAEAAERFRARGFDDCLEPREDSPGRFRIDLPEINRRLLIRLGVPEDGIHVAPWCTWSASDLRLPSYRRDKGLNAMLGGVIFHQ